MLRRSNNLKFHSSSPKTTNWRDKYKNWTDCSKRPNNNTITKSEQLYKDSRTSLKPLRVSRLQAKNSAFWPTKRLLCYLSNWVSRNKHQKSCKKDLKTIFTKINEEKPNQTLNYRSSRLHDRNSYSTKSKVLNAHSTLTFLSFTPFIRANRSNTKRGSKPWPPNLTNKSMREKLTRTYQVGFWNRPISVATMLRNWRRRYS